MSYQNFIKKCLQEAAVIANESFGKVSGVTKEGDYTQVLTETDIAIGQFLVEKVKKNIS